MTAVTALMPPRRVPRATPTGAGRGDEEQHGAGTSDDQGEMDNTSRARSALRAVTGSLKLTYEDLPVRFGTDTGD